jgi:uncharacterized membrane protein (UPF0127 family)
MKQHLVSGFIAILLLLLLSLSLLVNSTPSSVSEPEQKQSLYSFVIPTIPAAGIEPYQITAKKSIVKILSSENRDDNSTITPEVIPVYIEIADDPQEQIRGLMFRKSLESNSGMLFVYEDTANQSFWMKNTLIPLDMIFIDNNLRIVDIKQNVRPCLHENPCPSYTSIKPAKYVLEVNAGFVQQNNINVGDRLEI